MLIEDHLLKSAKQIQSPNYSERLNEDDINLIVIHSISLPPGKYNNSYIEEFFCNKLSVNENKYFESISDLKVSSHILIKRDGKIIQFVPFNKKAWHAGESVFKGRLNCNEFSIGIELEGCEEDDFTQNQYKNLVNICLTLFKYYPEITRQNVVGHSEIAPGRKTDPGKNFNWEYLRENL
ncbi:1,6-anhydro-N-acetylmuramyl-L-alanine amidase AmpD [Pseudomonadota bacterium]|jgi:AmpD protein|nr:1,6-anhydro-N-acetylmuramyl-L-alanine amidase AmpD [Pseudomonadota bacterium]|tara:strand:- start:654 stop:1193 length:540 start_codon:yes stop_codon:yes gene_type:complete